MIEKFMTDAKAKKDKVIKEKLLEHGIDFNLENEQKRRFKSIMVEHVNNEETYYYNDGSISGFRIVTFKTSYPEFDFSNQEHKVFISITHY